MFVTPFSPIAPPPAPARRLLSILLPLLLSLGPSSAFAEFDYDLVLRGGTLYLGGEAIEGQGDLAIRDDRIVAVGEAPGARGARSTPPAWWWRPASSISTATPTRSITWRAGCRFPDRCTRI